MTKQRYCEKCGSKMIMIENQPVFTKFPEMYNHYNRFTGKKDITLATNYKCPKYKWYNGHDNYQEINY